MTQEYVGVKQVTAWPQEKDGKEGYAVKYADGYTSWSPKAVFEEAYLPLGHISHMPPHQQRVIGEKAIVRNWRDKLEAFSETELFKSLPAAEQARLSAQFAAMVEYTVILAQRIEAF